METGLKNLDIRELLGSFIESDGAGGWRLKTDGTLITGFATETTLLSVLTELESIKDFVKKAIGGTSSSVPANLASVELIAANANRKSVYITNDGDDNLFIKYGTAATTSSWTIKLESGDQAIIDDYVGVIHGIWDVATGNARITETV